MFGQQTALVLIFRFGNGSVFPTEFYRSFLTEKGDLDENRKCGKKNSLFHIHICCKCNQKGIRH